MRQGRLEGKQRRTMEEIEDLLGKKMKKKIPIKELVSVCGLRMTDCGLRTVYCGMRTADCDCGLRTEGFRLRFHLAGGHT